MAIALPSVALPLLAPVEEVSSLLKLRQPLGQEVLSSSPPIRRKSAPSLNVCEPTNFETLPLTPDDV